MKNIKQRKSGYSKLIDVINVIGVLYIVLVAVMVIIVLPVSLYFNNMTGVALTIVSVMFGCLLGCIFGLIRAIGNPSEIESFRVTLPKNSHECCEDNKTGGGMAAAKAADYLGWW